MYTLIKEGLASKFELEEYYTLDEALKLYALYKMGQDIQAGINDEMKAKAERR